MKEIRFKDYLIDYLEFYNITQKEFSTRIGITQKHLIDILAGKCDLSSKVIDNISLVTNIPTDYIYRIESNYKLEKAIYNFLSEKHLTSSSYLSRFNYKYLENKKWISFTDTTDKFEMLKDIIKYLRVPNPDTIYELDKNIFYKSKNDKPELLLIWLERCYQKTLEQQVLEYNSNNLDDVIANILEMAKANEFDRAKLQKMFNHYGLLFVMEEDIPTSKIRGAFKVLKDKPAIYLTYKYHRIADIYFALLHELAHCKRDFNQAKATNFITFDESTLENAEQSADKQALEWMVDNDYYNSICIKKDYDITKETKYPKSFIVYRLAMDNYITYSSTLYQTYNILIKYDEQKNN